MPSMEEYIEEIRSIWDSHWLTNMGEKHKALQAELQKYMGVPAVELLTNGHMALELSLQAMNLQGEVITTPFTFASTTHAIVRNEVLKTVINFILLGKFQLERMWGDGGMPSAHSATVCAMVIATGRCVGVDSAIFAVASVVAIITMHDAMGVRHETGEQAKVLNQMIDQWIDISEKNAPFLQNMHLKEMVGHTPLQVVAGVLVGIAVGFLYPLV